MRWQTWGSVMTVALLAACGGGGDGEAAPRGPAANSAGNVDVRSVQLPGSLGCDRPDFAAALLHAINEARAQGRSCGAESFGAAPALQWNTLLGQAAAGHASDMASNGFFSHTGSNGSSSADRIRATGYQPRYHGEILAHPQGSHSRPDQVIAQSMASWLASPGHCRVIMSPSPNALGAACVRQGQKAWLAVDLGS
jgi:uncharacterized protein YkwD